jgi:SAM-dependent methyltransferase
VVRGRARGARTPVTAPVADAYSATGAAWQAGPGRIYDRLADLLVAQCPGGVSGRVVLDAGAGTGAATRAATRAGAAAVVPVDLAEGMLAGWDGERPPGAVGDLRRLPFRTHAFGAVVAAFSVNHVPDPAVALAEAARVLAPAGGLIVSAYGHDDTHPVKEVVEAALHRRGWSPPAWYEQFRGETVPLLATPERAAAAAQEAGLADVRSERVDVPFPDLGPADLVAWRLGMAPVAPFFGQLRARDRARLAAEAVAELGPGCEPLVRRIVVLTWQAPG